MTYPILTVIIDGTPASGLFYSTLINLRIEDREGIQSDSVSVTFNDEFPHFEAPRRGALIDVRIASVLGGEEYAGSYVIDEVTYNLLPYTITVKGHAADLRADMKTLRTVHWDDVSVRDIVSEKAADYGLEAKIADAVSGHVYGWIAQQDESDLNFLERLARRHGALFTIKSGTLLWLERGAGKTADGTAIPTSEIHRNSMVVGSCSVAETDVDRFATVKAYWQDRAGAKRQEVVVEADPEASGEYVLRDPYASEDAAKAAAEAAAREMLRGSITTNCSVVGRPGLMAGQAIRYVGARPTVDDHEFILEHVTHTFNKSGGVRTQFSGKLKAE